MSRQTRFEVGEFVQDGRAEAQIVEFSPDGFMVTIEYTDSHDTFRLQSNRLVRRNGELRVV